MEFGDFKVYARYLIGLLLFIIVAMYFSTIGFALLPAVFGLLVAFMLIPLSNKFRRVGFSENYSSLFAVGVFLAIIFGIVYICLLPLLKSTQRFFVSFPAFTVGIQSRLGIYRVFTALGIAEVISGVVNRFVEDIFSAQRIFAFMGSAFKWLYVLFLTPVFAFYIIRDRRQISEGLKYFVPQKHKKEIYGMLKEMYMGIKTYIYGYLFISLMCMGISLLAFAVVDLDSFLFLAFFMGVCSFIPFIGPIVGGIPAVIVASNYGWKLWYVLLVIGFVFQFAGSFLTPKTIGNSVNIHPIFGIITMVLGFGLFGIRGIVLAVPVLSVVKPIVKYIFSVLTTKEL